MEVEKLLAVEMRTERLTQGLPLESGNYYNTQAQRVTLFWRRFLQSEELVENAAREAAAAARCCKRRLRACKAHKLTGLPGLSGWHLFPLAHSNLVAQTLLCAR